MDITYSCCTRSLEFNFWGCLWLGKHQMEKNLFIVLGGLDMSQLSEGVGRCMSFWRSYSGGKPILDTYDTVVEIEQKSFS